MCDSTYACMKCLVWFITRGTSHKISNVDEILFEVFLKSLAQAEVVIAYKIGD